MTKDKEKKLEKETKSKIIKDIEKTKDKKIVKEAEAESLKTEKPEKSLEDKKRLF